MRGPILNRGLLRVASWVVPARLRPEWHSRWDSVLENGWILRDRGELNRAGEEWLAACCRASFREALHTRLRLVCSPAFLIATALSMLLLVGLSTGGFHETRALFGPLPVNDPGRQVAIRYTGSVGQPYGVPPRFVPLWASKSTLLSGIAGYWRRPKAFYARATTNFFDLLGARPARGRLFRPEDRDSAIVSGAYWRTVLRGWPDVVGSQVRVEGSLFTVVGVLPDSFWAISPQIGVWTPMHVTPEPDSDLPFLIGAIGRLKPGASWQDLRTDLFRAAHEAHERVPRPPEMWPASVPGPQIPGYLIGLAFAMAVGAFLVSRQQPLRLYPSWRYWGFLLAKIILLVMIPLLLWIETGRSIPVQARAPITLLFLGACALALWWSFADQRKRCPECLERLALPVTLGSWSSVLDPATTEFLCESGHGSLYVPETEQGQRDHWTTLDSSWREFIRHQ